jgi:hypothetical protein
MLNAKQHLSLLITKSHAHVIVTQKRKTMLTESEVKALLSHEDQEVSKQAAVVLRLIGLVKLNRDELQNTLTRKANK